MAVLCKLGCDTPRRPALTPWVESLASDPDPVQLEVEPSILVVAVLTGPGAGAALPLWARANAPIFLPPGTAPGVAGAVGGGVVVGQLLALAASRAIEEREAQSEANEKIALLLEQTRTVQAEAWWIDILSAALGSVSSRFAVGAPPASEAIQALIRPRLRMTNDCTTLRLQTEIRFFDAIVGSAGLSVDVRWPVALGCVARGQTGTYRPGGLSRHWLETARCSRPC
jgi:hypothetical protein